MIQDAGVRFEDWAEISAMRRILSLLAA